MQKMNKYYFNILGHRTEQDLFVRLVDSVTRQVRISSSYFLGIMYLCSIYRLPISRFLNYVVNRVGDFVYSAI